MNDDAGLVSGAEHLIEVKLVGGDGFNPFKTSLLEQLKRGQDRPLGLAYELERFFPGGARSIVGGEGGRGDRGGGEGRARGLEEGAVIDWAQHGDVALGA